MTLDLAAFATAPRRALQVTAFRNQPPGYDPRAGEGARIHGGRFNPPDSFPVLYLCETRACVVAELTRQGTRNVVGVEALLPRVLLRYQLDLDRVLDLTDPATRAHLGVNVTELTGDHRGLCWQLGTSAYEGGDQAIRTPSATGVDNVLAVFPELLGSSLVEVVEVERWTTQGELTPWV